MMNPDRIMAGPILAGAGAHMSRHRVVVCAYHGVDDPVRFGEQIRWLASERTPISLMDLQSSVESGRPLPDRSFLVTFDDGRRSVLEQGLPVLESVGVPAALFAIAGLIGTDEPYWWDEAEQLAASGGRTELSAAGGSVLVREMKQMPDDDRLSALRDLRATSIRQADRYAHLTAAELVELDRRGVAIGSHSLTHPCLDRCTPEVATNDLMESRRLLESWLGRPVTAIAYPNGNVDRKVELATRHAGFELGFLFDHRLSVNPIGDPLRISRVRVDSTTDMDRFRAIVAGVHPWLHRLRGRS